MSHQILQSQAQPGMRLGELLMDARVLSFEQLDKALEISGNTRYPLGRVLEMHGMINHNVLHTALRAQMSVRYRIIDRPRAIETIREAADKVFGALENKKSPDGIWLLDPPMTAPPAPFDPAQRAAGSPPGTIDRESRATHGVAPTAQPQGVAPTAQPQGVAPTAQPQAAFGAQTAPQAKDAPIHVAPPTSAPTPQSQTAAARREFLSKQAEVKTGGRRHTLVEFLAVTRAVNKDDLTRILKASPNATDREICSTLLADKATTWQMLELAKCCFVLVEASRWTFDDALFAFHYCTFEIEKGAAVSEAMHKWIQETGIAAWQDLLPPKSAGF